MRFGDPLNDRKAEAEAALGARSGFVGAEEALEDVGGVVGWNADPGVGDTQADAVRVAGGERHFGLYGAARRGVTNGVIEKIEYEPPQEFLVAGEGEIGFGV